MLTETAFRRSIYTHEAFNISFVFIRWFGSLLQWKWLSGCWCYTNRALHCSRDWHSVKSRFSNKNEFSLSVRFQTLSSNHYMFTSVFFFAKLPPRSHTARSDAMVASSNKVTYRLLILAPVPHFQPIDFCASSGTRHRYFSSRKQLLRRLRVSSHRLDNQSLQRYRFSCFKF